MPEGAIPLFYETERDWTDSHGTTWRLACHWSIVAGRLTLVGLDVQSPAGAPAEVDQRVLRSLPFAATREATRLEVIDRPDYPGLGAAFLKDLDGRVRDLERDMDERRRAEMGDDL